MTSFRDRLWQRARAAESLLCVGIDPHPKLMPSHFDAKNPDDVLGFCQAIVSVTAPHACAFKPQFAHFAALGMSDVLMRLIDFIKRTHPSIPVILDAKRGDIGSTADRYAVEAFEVMGADAVTVNPYMGSDTLQPFLKHDDKGVIVLCRTSNPGSGDFQDLVCDGEPLFIHVAKRMQALDEGRGCIGLVVGATWPEQLKQVRKVAPTLPILVPGIGAQGGDLEATLSAGLDQDKLGLLISSSRGINYAANDETFRDKAGMAAKTIQVAIQKHVNAI